MALTVPEFTYSTPAAYVIASADYLGSTLQIPVRSDEMAEWTDDQVNTWMANLKSAIAVFMPPEMSGVSVTLEWSSSAAATITPPL